MESVVRCDLCGRLGDGVDPFDVGAAGSRWVQVRAGGKYGDLCPDCAERLESAVEGLKATGPTEGGE
jgi:hypothetical protein